MYKIKILHPQQGVPALTLTTSNRNLARSVVLICQENKLPVTVTREVQPVAVKFKGVD